jgi:acyl-CoA synthetase (AMP-forming)/AMP-acid ligase II/acyl carrier protein
MNYSNFENWNELLDYRASAYADKRAFTFLGENQEELASLSYAELLQRVKALASMLKAKGNHGDRVLLLYPAGLDYVVAFYACLYAGMVAVPLYSPQNKRKIELIGEIANDCGAILALTTQKYLSKVDNLTGRGIEQLKWLATDHVFDPADDLKAADVSGDELAYLQYTSGSTSLPKGVMLTHATTLFHSEELATHWQANKQSVLVSWLPHFHDLGQVLSILQPVYRGFHCVLMSPTTFMKQPYIWLKAISDYRATIGGGPDFTYSHSVRNVTKEQIKTLDLSTWRCAINGAEPVKSATLQAFSEHFAEAGFKHAAHCPAYGLAESTLVMASEQPDRDPILLPCNSKQLRSNKVVVENASEDTQFLVSNGKPVMGTQVKVVNSKSNIELNEAEIGEIWISGGSIGSGYWNNEEATLQTFKAKIEGEPEQCLYLRTGDLGFIYEGNLYITGRLKDLIVVRGTNHYPQDIEQTVELSHGLIRDGYCAAFSIEQSGEEQLVVVAERNRYHSEEVDYEQVFANIKAAIAQRHSLDVSQIVIVRPGSITKTTSGKIQRRKCKNELHEGVLSILAHYQQPAESAKPSKTQNQTPESVKNMLNQPTSLEEMLKQNIRNFVSGWIANQVNVPLASIDGSKSFADYGLNSMDTFSFHSDLEVWMQKSVDEEVIWESSTIDVLINSITAESFGAITNNKVKPTPEEA